MNFYENEFVYGRRMLKYTMSVSIVCCVATLIAQAGTSMHNICFVLAIASFAFAVYIIYRYCRCPHCKKVIFLGVLSINTCPKCKHNLITGKKVKKSKR